jgi:CRISPR system Cascade subunit CasA
MFSFDLRLEPWIPVRDRENTLREISLHEALTNAASYQRIESESPLEVAALYRFLLAVLHRALEGPTTPKDNARWFREGFDLAAIEAYLERYEECFDLFHRQYPFYQVAEMPFEGFTQHWSRLSTEFGSGNTSPLFNYAKRDTAPKEPNSWVTPAQAARLVLEHQTFCLGGLIKRFITSSPSAPTATAAHVLVVGNDLHQTLCLNLVNYPAEQYRNDRAIWESDPPKVAVLKKDPAEIPRGLVHRYTWMSRTIKLFPEVFNGVVGVRHLAFASAVRPKDFGFDAMAAYCVPRRATKKDTLEGLRLNTDRGLWRDFTALLPDKTGQSSDVVPAVIVQAVATLAELEQTRRPQRGLVVEVYGQMSNQGKVELWRSEAHRLPKAILGQRNVRKTVETLLGSADEAWEALDRSCRTLAGVILTLGERNPRKDDVTSFAQSLPARLVYWTDLERHFYRLIGELDDAYDETDVEKRWAQTLIDTANLAWDTTLRSTGSNPRALKAATTAQGPLYSHLKKLRESYGLATKGGNGEQNQQG